MLTLNKFAPYENEYSDWIVPGACFIESEDGLDWYYHLTRFASDTVKIAYDAVGVVRFIQTDASKIWPDGLSVTEILADNLPDGADNSGQWVISNGSVIARVLTAAEKLQKAEEERASLIETARQTMNEWQNDLLLDDISDSERALLKTWNAYVKQLKALDLTTGEEIAWPPVPALTADAS